MTLVRRLVELGRSARAGASIRTRQPLRRALVGAAGFSELPAELQAEIAAELNVSRLEVLDWAGELVDYLVKPNFRVLGRRFGPRTQAVAAAMLAVPAADVATAALAGGTVTVTVDAFDEPVVVGADDLIVTQTPRAGWAVATDSGETVAIDTTVSPELRREGLAREVIRLVQEARKNDGLEVTDRIWLRWWSEDPEVTAALTEHAGLIAGEVLAVDYAPGPAPAAAEAAAAGVHVQAAWQHVEDDLRLTFWLGRA
jgi:isoleucyl-tRNA synthetase